MDEVLQERGPRDCRISGGRHAQRLDDRRFPSTIMPDDDGDRGFKLDHGEGVRVERSDSLDPEFFNDGHGQARYASLPPRADAAQ